MRAQVTPVRTPMYMRLTLTLSLPPRRVKEGPGFPWISACLSCMNEEESDASLKALERHLKSLSVTRASSIALEYFSTAKAPIDKQCNATSRNRDGERVLLFLSSTLQLGLLRTRRSGRPAKGKTLLVFSLTPSPSVRGARRGWQRPYLDQVGHGDEKRLRIK